MISGLDLLVGNEQFNRAAPGFDKQRRLVRQKRQRLGDYDERSELAELSATTDLLRGLIVIAAFRLFRAAPLYHRLTGDHFRFVKADPKRISEPQFIICGDQHRRDSLFVFSFVGSEKIGVDTMVAVPKHESCPVSPRYCFPLLCERLPQSPRCYFQFVQLREVKCGSQCAPCKTSSVIARPALFPGKTSRISNVRVSPGCAKMSGNSTRCQRRESVKTRSRKGLSL
jgi:hypothetical protein